jgi:hypothetical protein
LDKPTRARIIEKLKEIAKDPFNPRLSYPLVSSTKRSSRVGDTGFSSRSMASFWMSRILARVDRSTGRLK